MLIGNNCWLQERKGNCSKICPVDGRRSAVDDSLPQVFQKRNKIRTEMKLKLRVAVWRGELDEWRLGTGAGRDAGGGGGGGGGGRISATYVRETGLRHTLLPPLLPAETELLLQRSSSIGDGGTAGLHRGAAGCDRGESPLQHRHQHDRLLRGFPGRLRRHSPLVGRSENRT